MKQKYIENQLIYRVTNYIYNILVSSMVTNIPLYIVFIYHIFIEKSVPFVSILIAAGVSLTVPLNLAISFVSHTKKSFSKKKIINLGIVTLGAQLCMGILLVNFYYFVVIKKILIAAPTLIFLFINLISLTLWTLFSVYESKDLETSGIFQIIRNSAARVITNVKVILLNLIMFIIYLGIASNNILLSLLLFPGLFIVINYFYYVKGVL